MGIPYAKPPVGALRWKAPEPLQSSDNVFEAQNSGASAIQVEHEGVILKHHRQSEDCLYLNLYTAAEKSDKKKPVLVLFSHGRFTYGGAVDPLFYGNKIIKEHEDIIFVSFNYRLGIFGFIDFSASQMYGSLMNEDLSEILQTLLYKFIKGDALQLYNNEVEYVNAMTWESFPKALVISDGKITCDRIEDRLTDEKALLDFLVK